MTPHPGAPRKVTAAYRKKLVHAVRLVRAAWDCPSPCGRLQRLADYMAEQTGIRLSYESVRAHLKAARNRPQPPPAHLTSPDPEYALKKRRSKRSATASSRESIFYYADEFNLSWMPTLKDIWGPRGQQVMIPTPAQPKKRYGIGAVNYHTGETVVAVPPSQTPARDRPVARSAVGEAPQRDQSTWPGTIPTPTKTMRSRLSCAAPPDGCSCSPCRLTARGSTPSRCSGATSGGRSPTASCSRT